jgi:urease alpha subunit
VTGMPFRLDIVETGEQWVVTTLFGGGIGPTDGSNGTTVTAGPWNIEMMLRSIEGLPVNIGILGQGSSAGEAALVEQCWPARLGSRSTRTGGRLLR